MNEFRADLHCHTNCSDGTLSPIEILSLAKEKGLQGLSISDHDSIEAYPSALPAASEIGLSLISGIEFSSIFQGTSVHILGYSFSTSHNAILSLCSRHQERRLQRNRAILDKLAADNMNISEEELHISQEGKKLPAHHTVGRPHIALAMIKKGYVKNVFDAFKIYLGEDCPYYVRGELIDVEETLQIIHEAKGFAIIAHPHLIRERKIIHDLLKMNFDGLEGYYANISAEQNNQWVKTAKKKNWIITGGSDFHGDIKPSINLGASWTNEETFKILQQRFVQNELL